MAQRKTPAPVDDNEPRLAYHPGLDRYVNTPLGNLHLFTGWEDHGPAVDVDTLAELNAASALNGIPPVAGLSTPDPAVTGSPTVAAGDQNQE